MLNEAEKGRVKMLKNFLKKKLLIMPFIAIITVGSVVSIAACSNSNKLTSSVGSSDKSFKSSFKAFSEISSFTPSSKEVNSSSLIISSSSVNNTFSSETNSAYISDSVSPAWSYRCEGSQVADISHIINWCNDFGGSPGFSVSVKYDSLSDKYNFIDEGIAADVIDYIIITDTKIKFFLRKGIAASPLGRGIDGQLRINLYFKETQKLNDGTEYKIWAHEYEKSGGTNYTTEDGRAVIIQPINQSFKKGQIKDFNFEWGKVD
jgi:hypothetical protein